MGLKLVANPTFPGHADITVAGEEMPQRITVVWKHMTLKKVGEWMESNKTRSAVESLQDVIQSWEGPEDENGNPEAFSAESLSKLLENRPVAGSELIAAWMTQLTESRVKNSKALSGN